MVAFAVADGYKELCINRLDKSDNISPLVTCQNALITLGSSTFSNHQYSKEASTNFAVELPKDVNALTTMFDGMLSFEKKYNKERALKNKKVVCFACQKEGHTIHSCYKVFPHLKEKNDEGNQECKSWYQRDGYKNKKKTKAMQASSWCIDSDSSESDESDEERADEGENLALMAIVTRVNFIEEMEAIIANKKITDEVTINALMSVARLKEEKAKASEETEGESEDLTEAVENDEAKVEEVKALVSTSSDNQGEEDEEIEEPKITEASTAMFSNSESEVYQTLSNYECETSSNHENQNELNDVSETVNQIELVEPTIDETRTNLSNVYVEK